MVQLIVGEKGKGKTKVLLDKVNNEIKTINGNVVYLDKSTEHMFELNNRIRLIDVCEYNITNADQFIGFVTGIISQDHDLEKVYLDSFLKVAHLDAAAADAAVEKLDEVSKKFNLDIIVSFSQKSADLSETVKSKVKVAL